MAGSTIDENLLVEFLEDDGIDVSTAKFLHVRLCFEYTHYCVDQFYWFKKLHFLLVLPSLFIRAKSWFVYSFAIG